MRCGGWKVGVLVGGSMLIVASGCTSMNDHLRLQAAHRNLKAEKEAMAQELFDARNGNDSLRMRADSLQREMDTQSELLANLRGENELLDQMRRTAQDTLEGVANNQTLGNITLAGPKLPAQLDSALKRFADQHPSAVDYDSTRGTIKWKSDLLFALGSDVVKESSMEALRGFTDVIKSQAASEFEVIIVGHTDNTPIVRPKTKQKHPTNWHLSAHRAIAVAGVLGRFGYPSRRMGVMGYGEYRPVADNAAAEGKAQNRRVEVYLIPTGAIVKSADAGSRVVGEALAFVSLTR